MSDPKKVIVTHQNPDVDAICGIWQLQRFDKEIYQTSQISFVPAGNQISDQQLTDLNITRQEVTHVDTGNIDFDHHDDRHTGQSASLLIFHYLIDKYNYLKDDQALKRVVEFANRSDQFDSYYWPESTNDRYMFMIENILNGYKLGGHGDDHELVRLGSECLDGAYSMLKITIEAEKEIGVGTEFISKWGKSLALSSSNDSAIKLAQKMGYNIAVRKDPDGGNIRIKAAPLPQIDLTPVYKAIVDLDRAGTWYFHPGRHMLLNGSKKHQGQKPSPLSLDQVIEVIKSIK